MTTTDITTHEGELITDSDTASMVADYKKRYTTERLAELAEKHHMQAQTHMGNAVTLIWKGLESARRCGAVLLATRQKAERFLTPDNALICGTSISRSTAYRYMELATYWHLLPTDHGEPMSLRGAMAHIADERKRLAAPQGFEDLEDELPDAEEPSERRRPGRPTEATRLRRRITSLATDARQMMYMDPHQCLPVIGEGIRELQRVQDELQDYIDGEGRS